MSRRTELVTIDAEGRDQGRQYLLTEMPAMQAQKWALRAFLALAKSGVEIPDTIAAQGLAGMTQISLGALRGLNPELAEPLLDSLMQCVAFQARATVRPLVEDDIEEVLTLLQLQAKVFALHVGFSTSERLSNLITNLVAKADVSPIISTSPQ